MNISLSQGKFALIDDEDYPKVSQYKWCYLKAYVGKLKKCEYAVTYTKGSHKTRKNLRLHRFIMNAKKGQMVDHKNGNGLDNRKENLRFCTPSTNQANRQSQANKIYSQYKGVSKYKDGKWTAGIYKNGKQFNLGSFDTAKQAAKAYNKIAKELHGEFAILNKF